MAVGMRVAALFSGGKDSNLALDVALQSGFEVTHLVTVTPRDEESMMFHVPNLDVAPLLAEARGIPLVRVDADADAARELDSLEETLRGLDVDAIVSGALASEYQRTRLERVAHRVGIRSFTPLWHKRPRDVLESLVRGGYDVRFGAVAAEGFNERWLGRRLDDAALADLLALEARHGVHPAGEGGEYESIVLDGPFFLKRIVVEEAVKEWRRDSGNWRIVRARLQEKPASVGVANPASSN